MTPPTPTPTPSPSPSRIAPAAHPIHPLLAERHSPYLYDPRPVAPETLKSCLTAASWAASSFNEQPWRFIVGRRENEAEFAKVLGCLVEANRGWAKDAGVLIITVAKRTFSRNNKPNRVAEHDVGMASANLAFEAVSHGLQVHQMGGIDMTACRHTFSIPEGFDPVTGIALGYAGDAAARLAKDPQDDLAKRDLNPRTRNPLDAWVFAGDWENAAEF